MKIEEQMLNTIHHGDCLDVLKAMEDNSVDSVERKTQMTKKTSENRHALIAALVRHFREHPKRFEGTSRELGQLITPKKKTDSAQLTRVLDRYAAALNQEGWSIGVEPQRYKNQPRVWIIEPPAFEQEPRKAPEEETVVRHDYEPVKIHMPNRFVFDPSSDALLQLTRVPAQLTRHDAKMSEQIAALYHSYAEGRKSQSGETRVLLADVKRNTRLLERIVERFDAIDEKLDGIERTIDAVERTTHNAVERYEDCRRFKEEREAKEIKEMSEFLQEQRREDEELIAREKAARLKHRKPWWRLFG